jgi:hypothetical protein
MYYFYGCYFSIIKLRILSLWKVSTNLVPKPTNYFTSFFPPFSIAFHVTSIFLGFAFHLAYDNCKTLALVLVTSFGLGQK